MMLLNERGRRAREKVIAERDNVALKAGEREREREDLRMGYVLFQCGMRELDVRKTK